MNDSASSGACGAMLTHVPPSCFKDRKLSSLAGTEFAPILTPGGIGVSLAEPLRMVAAAVAPARAILANCLRSVIVIAPLEFYPDRSLNVGASAAEVREIAHCSAEPGPGCRVVQVVRGVRR